MRTHNYTNFPNVMQKQGMMNLIATCTALPTQKVVHWETLRGFILIKPVYKRVACYLYIVIQGTKSRTVCARIQYIPGIAIVSWFTVVQQKSYITFAHNIGIPVYPLQLSLLGITSHRYASCFCGCMQCRVVCMDWNAFSCIADKGL